MLWELRFSWWVIQLFCTFSLQDIFFFLGNFKHYFEYCVNKVTVKFFWEDLNFYFKSLNILAQRPASRVSLLACRSETRSYVACLPIWNETVLLETYWAPETLWGHFRHFSGSMGFGGPMRHFWEHLIHFRDIFGTLWNLWGTFDEHLGDKEVLWRPLGQL